MGKLSKHKSWRKEMSQAGMKLRPRRTSRMIRLGLEREGIDIPPEGDEKACRECGWWIPVNGYDICADCVKDA